MFHKLKVIIVDDELPARRELSYLLNNYFSDKIEIISEGEHGLSAVKKIKELKPDVVFLDINMPGISGLEVANITLKFDPEILIVFVTAFDDFALKAFELHAVDYLVKPFELPRIEKSITRLLQEKEKINNQNLHDIITKINNDVHPKFNKVPCEDTGKILLFKPEDIYYCSVEDGKTFIFTKDKKYRTFYTLNDLEEKLSFFRAHRSFLVNLDYIHIIEPWFHSSYRLIMDNERKTEIPVSRIQSKKLKELLEL